MNSGLGSWHLAEIHVCEGLGRHLLLDVCRGRVYEVDEPISAFVRTAQSEGGLDKAASAVKSRWGLFRLSTLWHWLEKRELLVRQAVLRPSPPAETGPEPVTALDLNVTHRCNLACRYCYGAYGDLLTKTDQKVRYGSEQSWMSSEVAEAAFEFLLRESGNCRQISVIFFGGEPLLNLRLIRKLVPLFRRKARVAGKSLGLSTATNATLLSRKVLGFLVENQIGIQFSFDGPAAVQDDQRVDRKGGGTYAKVVAAANRLFAMRPNSVTARATLTRRNLDIPGIVKHLLGLGFENVHVEPATGIENGYGVGPDCLPQILEQYEQLAVLFLERIEQGELLNFSNFVKYVRSTKNPGQARFYPCGAGRGYICADPSGTLFLCHRFTGMQEYSVGDVFSGLNDRVRSEVRRLHVDARPACSKCWARYYCGGGCWRVNVGASGTLTDPDVNFSCLLQKRVIELSMAINAYLADDEAELLSGRYTEARLPYQS